MAVAREREQDEQAQATAAPETVPEGPAAVPTGPMSPAGVMALQRLVGNSAVAGMLDERRTPDGAPPEASSAAPPETSSAGPAPAPPAPAQDSPGTATDQPQTPGGVLGAFEAIVRGSAAEQTPQEGAGTAGVLAGMLPGFLGQHLPQGVPVPPGAAPGTVGAVAGAAGAAALGAGAGAAGAAALGAGAAAAAAGPNAAGATAASAKGGAAAGAAPAGAAPAGATAGGGGGGGAAAAPAQQAPAGGGAAAPAAASGGAAGAAAAPAEAAPKREPSDDPNFQAMKGKSGAAGEKAKAHQPAAAGASAAQAAAQPPGNEVASQAQGAQVEEMGKQQPGVFDRKAFIAAVKKAIDAAAPKNLEEADDFKGSGKVGEAKEQVGALVKGGKKDAEKDIKGATEAPPDTSKGRPKQVVPLQPDDPGTATASVGAAGAMPGPRPAEDTDLSEGPAEVEQQMVDAEVTETQLQNANEPEFNAALDAKQEAKQHATTAPAEYRAQEEGILAQGREEAAGVEANQLKGMQGSKVDAIAKIAGHKGETKTEDETKRSKVATDIQAIYAKTKTEVTGILEALDGKVEATFTRGEASARTQFENHVGARMDAYKDDRYSGFFGGARWLKDKLFGMPSEVNVFYSEGRDGYMTAMDGVIGEVADLVGNELNAARMKIAAGRAEVHDYVTQLPQDLQKVGKDAEAKLDQQWDDLSSDVDNKQDAMVDQLAQKYVASRDALDERIEELKAANKGLVAKAIDAVVGVIKTILKLKDMLFNVLAKAASVIGDIISDPIGFLSNLVDGIKQGLTGFMDRIGTHLENGLMGWLFGALGDAGIKMPKSFDLAGIFELVMDVLGLTYRSIRGRVAKIVGEPVVEKMESTVDVFKKLATEGIAGVWEWIKEKVGDFKDLVLGGIKDFIIERVIKGGITWILSLLNPAAAFIKACKAIYDIVMFIVERGQQIMEFVNSVIDSIGAIARGNLSEAAQKVEGALAKALPLAISFLASLLGLGGITDKIKEGIDKVRKPIEKAVDFVVLGAVKGFKKVFGGAIGWVKGKAEKGKQWATAKVEARQGPGSRARPQGIKDRFTGGDKDEGPRAGPRARPRRRHRQGVIAEEEVDAAPDDQHTLKAEVDESRQRSSSSSTACRNSCRTFSATSSRGSDELPERAPRSTLPPRRQAWRAAGQIRRIRPIAEINGARATSSCHDAAGHRRPSALHRPRREWRAAYKRDPDRHRGAQHRWGTRSSDLLQPVPRLRRQEFELRGRRAGVSAGAEDDRTASPSLRRPGERTLPQDEGRAERARSSTASGDLDDPQCTWLKTPSSSSTAASAPVASCTPMPRGRRSSRAPTRSRTRCSSVRGRTGGTPDTGSNESHTEAQFYSWFESQGEDWHKRVVAVELRSVLSMCGDCTKSLGGISPADRPTRRRRAAGHQGRVLGRRCGRQPKKPPSG